MSKVKFELNYSGVGKLLKSDDMKAICEEHANMVQSRAGSGCEVTTYTGPTRVNASVHAVTKKARKDNAENNTLLKSLY